MSNVDGYTDVRMLLRSQELFRLFINVYHTDSPMFFKL